MRLVESLDGWWRQLCAIGVLEDRVVEIFQRHINPTIIVLRAKGNVETKDIEIDVHITSDWGTFDVQAGGNLNADVNRDQPEIQSEFDANGQTAISNEPKWLVVYQEVDVRIEPGAQKTDG